MSALFSASAASATSLSTLGCGDADSLSSASASPFRAALRADSALMRSASQSDLSLRMRRSFPRQESTFAAAVFMSALRRASSPFRRSTASQSSGFPHTGHEVSPPLRAPSALLCESISERATARVDWSSDTSSSAAVISSSDGCAFASASASALTHASACTLADATRVAAS